MKSPLTYGIGILLSCSAILAQPTKEWPPQSPQLSRIANAIEGLESGDCPSYSSPRISDQRYEDLLKGLLSETISLDGAVELAEGTWQYRCSLSQPSQHALDALMMEAKVRRFDFKSFTQGEIDLVVPQIMPEQWDILMEETGHNDRRDLVPTKGAPILVIGCVVAATGGFGLIQACLRDVQQALEQCLGGLLCTPPKVSNFGCCSDLASDDRINCMLSVGQNGPDNDYNTCCRDPL